LRRSHRVGAYTITWTFDIDGFKPGVRGQTNVEWVPSLPPKGWLTKARRDRYLEGRNAIFQEAANIIGGNILVTDI
jgi:hypothetical protein